MMVEKMCEDPVVYGRVFFNGMEIGCREKTEGLNRALSRDDGKEGIYCSAVEAFLFSLCNSLFDVHLRTYRFSSTRIFVSSVSSISSCSRCFFRRNILLSLRN